MGWWQFEKELPGIRVETVGKPLKPCSASSGSARWQWKTIDTLVCAQCHQPGEICAGNFSTHVWWYPDLWRSWTHFLQKLSVKAVSLYYFLLAKRCLPSLMLVCWISCCSYLTILHTQAPSVGCCWTNQTSSQFITIAYRENNYLSNDQIARVLRKPTDQSAMDQGSMIGSCEHAKEVVLAVGSSWSFIKQWLIWISQVWSDHTVCYWLNRCLSFVVDHVLVDIGSYWSSINNQLLIMNLSAINPGLLIIDFQ